MEYRKSRLSSSELRLIARNKLKGHYGIFIGMFFVLLFIEMGMSQVTSFIDLGFTSATVLYSNPMQLFERPAALAEYGVLSFIVTVVMYVFDVGLTKLHLDLAEDRDLLFSNIVYGFKTGPLRYVAGYLLVTLIMLVPSAMFFGGTVLIVVSGISEIVTMGLVGMGLYVLGLVIMIPLDFSLKMVVYVLTDKPETSAVEAIAESMKMMKGNKWKLFCLGLSFIGWFILSIFTFGLLLLWLIPYVDQAEVLFYKEISGQIRLVDESEDIVYDSGQ